MAISDVIKEYRMKREMTQAQLAETVGVTPQAISKWEKGTGSPDLSLIVPLANALQISTDVLLEHKNTLRELNGKWLRLHTKCYKLEVPWEELVKLDNDILNDYPHDETQLYRRICDEIFVARSKTDPEEKKHWLIRARAHCSAVIDEFPDWNAPKIKMVEIMMEQGLTNSAIFWAHKCEDPDEAMKMVLRGDELRRHKQGLIDKKLRNLLREMQYPDFDFLQASENIIRAVFPDENYQYYYDSLMMIEYTRARYYAERGDLDNAISHLYIALEYAKAKLIKGQGRFTSPIFDELTTASDPITLIEQLCHMLEKTQSFDFESIYHTEKYQKLLADVRALIGK